MPIVKEPLKKLKLAERNESVARRRELKKNYLLKTRKINGDPRKKLLTTFVLKKGNNLKLLQRRYFNLYVYAEIEQIRLLRNGVPYVLVDDPFVNTIGGVFVIDLNQPLILVSVKLPEIHQRDTATHEFNEWSRSYFGYDPKGEVHLNAEKELPANRRKEFENIIKQYRDSDD